jgi:hypothetical protein
MMGKKPKTIVPLTPAVMIKTIPKQDVPARLAALAGADIRDLKNEWRSLFGTEPPPYNRRFLESRLAYRIQELACGGLKAELVKHLEELGEQIDGKNMILRRVRQEQRPVPGTRLLREYHGVEHIATVTRDGFEYQGRPYQSLSAVARAITGTRWNGWAFFGLPKARP